MSTNRFIMPTIDWETVQRDFPCPPELWQGIWAEVAASCGKGWDVWAATYSALCALAGRNLHWYYYKAPLFGMSYVLSIAPTGAGKEFGIDIAAALLPQDYNQRGAVQSGPALFPILADTASKERIKPARPTILLINEWTNLVRLGGIQHSTLVDILDSLFHCSRPWNLSRSDRDTVSGMGGDRIMAPPTLSIYGATTPGALLQEVNNDLVNKGFLNRYLILPGPTGEWDFWLDDAPSADPAVILAPLRLKLENLRSYQWGGGRNFQEALMPAAADRLRAWGRPRFNPLMRGSSVETNRKKRLHFYAHHIAFLSAWSRRADMVERTDVELAIAVIEASDRFIDFLWRDDPIPVTTAEAGDSRLEALVRSKIQERPDYYDTYRLREGLRRQWSGLSIPKLSRALHFLMQAGEIVKNPATMRYVTREQAQALNGKGEKGDKSSPRQVLDITSRLEGRRATDS